MAAPGWWPRGRVRAAMGGTARARRRCGGTTLPPRTPIPTVEGMGGSRRPPAAAEVRTTGGGCATAAEARPLPDPPPHPHTPHASSPLPRHAPSRRTGSAGKTTGDVDKAANPRCPSADQMPTSISEASAPPTPPHPPLLHHTHFSPLERLTPLPPPSVAASSRSYPARSCTRAAANGSTPTRRRAPRASRGRQRRPRRLRRPRRRGRHRSGRRGRPPRRSPLTGGCSQWGIPPPRRVPRRRRRQRGQWGGGDMEGGGGVVRGREWRRPSPHPHPHPHPGL